MQAGRQTDIWGDRRVGLTEIDRDTMDLIITASTLQAGIQRKMNSVHFYRQSWCPSSVFKHPP